MSKTCCAAIVWAIVTSPMLTFIPVGIIAHSGGPLGMSFAHNALLRAAIFLGLPVMGIFIAVKGVTDVRHDPFLRGGGVGIIAIWIDFISLIVGVNFI